MIQINKNPSKTELFWFGMLCIGFFGLLGLSVMHKSHSMRGARDVWIAGAVLVVIYFAISPLRRPIYLGWMYAAFPLGWVVSHVLLTVAYFGVIVPVGLLMRLMAQDPLTRKFEPTAATYWTPHDPGTDPDRYFRQS